MPGSVFRSDTERFFDRMLGLGKWIDCEPCAIHEGAAHVIHHVDSFACVDGPRYGLGCLGYVRVDKWDDLLGPR